MSFVPPPITKKQAIAILDAHGVRGSANVVGMCTDSQQRWEIIRFTVLPKMDIINRVLAGSASAKSASSSKKKKTSASKKRAKSAKKKA
jgi:hypothetical protein